MPLIMDWSGSGRPVMIIPVSSNLAPSPTFPPLLPRVVDIRSFNSRIVDIHTILQRVVSSLDKDITINAPWADRENGRACIKCTTYAIRV